MVMASMATEIVVAVVVVVNDRNYNNQQLGIDEQEKFASEAYV